MKRKEISEQVDYLINSFETNNPFELAKQLGVTIIYRKFDNLKGLYAQVLDQRYIILNNQLDEHTLRITCAHELGHDQLHRGSGLNLAFCDKEASCPKERIVQEREANEFAALLLLPRDEILDMLQDGYTIDQLASHYHVHSELINYKVQQLNEQGFGFAVPDLPKSDYLSNR